MAKSTAFLVRPDLVDEMRNLVIVPDSVLADAGESEIYLSTFVTRYLDKSEWPQYIPEDRENYPAD